MQGKLTVTATFYLQGRNDVQGSCPQHLIFFIRKGYCRSHNDTVSSMNTNWVKVLHGTDGDDVAGGVALLGAAEEVERVTGYHAE